MVSVFTFTPNNRPILTDTSPSKNTFLSLYKDIKNISRGSQYHQLFATTTDPVILLDFETHTVLEINPSACQLFSTLPSRIIGKRIGDLKLFSNPEECIDFFRELSWQAPVCRRHCETTIADETKIFDIVGMIYEENNQIRIQCHIREQSMETKIDSQKNKFIMVTSHELKTPLTSQKIYIQLLEEELLTKGNSQSLVYINKIKQQVEKLSVLVSDLVDVSKVEHGSLTIRKVYTDVTKCVWQAITEIQNTTTQHNIRLRGSESIFMYIDLERIRHVMHNLLSNAIKYSPARTEINVTIDTSEHDVTIAVQDFGIGIDRLNHKKIFDRFFRVDTQQRDTYGGLGIGLYLSSEIVKKHGGSIDVKSDLGCGSTFIVKLPYK